MRTYSAAPRYTRVVLGVVALVFTATAATSGHHHRFDDVEKWVRIFEDPKRAAWQKPAEVIAALHVQPREVVVDLGAGTGYFTMPLARAVGHKGVVYAVDIEPNLIDHLRHRAIVEKAPMVKPVLADPSDPKLTVPVDLVLCVDTWHHIEDRPAYLNKLKASMKPGARLVIIDFKKMKTPMGPPLSMRLRASQVIEEVRAAGFDVREEHDFLPYQYFIDFVLVR